MPLEGIKTQNVPFVTWDNEKLQYRVHLCGVTFDESENHEAIITSKPDCLYRTRVKRLSDNQWTPGFISPLPNVNLTMLEDDTDYIIEMCKIDRDGNEIPGEVRTHKFRNNQLEDLT